MNHKIKSEIKKKLDELTKNSELTEEDIVKLGRKINEGIARKHGLRA